jgi:2-polyprenyl-3-methyl-5-hydroxy-6-metoxy-1,4-benzoquinol methylase
MYVDLEKPIKLSKTYDLVVSLEVAEHISEENADVFVQSLADAGKIILFRLQFQNKEVLIILMNNGQLIGSRNLRNMDMYFMI